MAGEQFLGHWKLDASENWDDYMKAAGKWTSHTSHYTKIFEKYSLTPCS